MRTALLRIFLLLAPLAGAARAQSVRWDPPGGVLGVGQTTALQLVCEDCEPKGTPSLPRVRALALEYSGQSSNISIINSAHSTSSGLRRP